MEETLISFKVAKLAKEKGFDWETQKVYDADETNIKNPTIYIYGEDLSGDDELYAPTQSLLQKWIREVHNISIKIDDFYTESKLRFDCNVCKLGSQEDNPKGCYSNYEEALEEGLYEALLLIKIKKDE